MRGLFFIGMCEFPLGGEGLAEAEAAVVGGAFVVGEDAEMAGLEVVLCEGEEEGVLEDAAGEGDGAEVGGGAGAVAGVGEEEGEFSVEGVGELADGGGGGCRNGVTLYSV